MPHEPPVAVVSSPPTEHAVSKRETPAPACPRCGTSHRVEQEYCLGCGERLPRRRVTRRPRIPLARTLGWPLAEWLVPAVAALVVAAIGAAAAIVLAGREEKRVPSTLVLTGGPPPTGAHATAPSTASQTTQPNAVAGKPQAPGASSTPRGTTPLAGTQPGATTGAPVAWPQGRNGYTIVLASIPRSAGRDAAFARARAAQAAGLPQVGVLDSSSYASLHPGYYVVFSGVYGSDAQAQDALHSVISSGFDHAYPTRIAS